MNHPRITYSAGVPDGGGECRSFTATTGFWFLILCCTNAGVKRAASAAPLERLVIRALDFDPEPLFWPFWYRTSRTLLLGLHGPSYWFLQPTKISFVKSKKRPGYTTAQKKQTKWNCHHFYLLQKMSTENITQKSNPPIWLFINSETSEPGFRVLTFWVSYNAGVKRLRVAQSAWKTCYASLLFWRWTFVLTFLALNLQSVTARFAQYPLPIFKPTKLGIFETKKNRPPF